MPMTSLGPWLLLCSGILGTTTAALVNPGSSNTTFFIAFSKAVGADATTQLLVHISGATGPVTLQVELLTHTDLRVQHGESYQLSQPNRVQTLSFKFAPYIKKPTMDTFLLHVRGWGGGVSFSALRSLTWKNEPLTVLLQTDKISYRPGDTVRFRALGMSKHMEVSNQPLEVTVRESTGNLVARFSRDINPKVLTGSFQLPEKSGSKTLVIRGSMKGGATEKKIYVNDYEDPPFEVSLEASSVDVYTEETVKIQATAKYLTGAPIAGSATITITYHSLYRTSRLNKTFELDKFGGALWEVTKADLAELVCKGAYSPSTCDPATTQYQLPGHQFLTQVTVQDLNSYHVVHASGQITLTALRHYMQFVDTVNVFRNGLPYHVYIQQTNSKGKPVENLKFKSAKVTVYYWRNSPGSTSCQEESKVLMKTKADFDPTTKIANVTVSVPQDACSVKLSVTGDGTTLSKSVYRYYSPSMTYLYLEYDQNSESGRKRKITVKSNKFFKEYIYSIFAKGRLVLSKKVTKAVETKVTSFQIVVKRQLAPLVHVLVYTVTDSKELAAAGLRLPVQYYPYETLMLFRKRREITVGPGEDVRVDLSSLKDTEVFMLGRDHSRMTTGNDISFDDVTNGLLAHDLSLPWDHIPGNALRGDYVFKIAGVQFISNLIMPRPYRSEKENSLHSQSLWRQARTFRCRRYSTVPEPSGSMDIDQIPQSRSSSSRAPDDTWLWTSVNMDTYKTSVRFRAPDTLSKLNITAFVIHPKAGISFPRDSIQLTTVKKLFTAMFTPKSAVRGEVVCFNAVAHNFDEKNHTVKMKISKSEDFAVANMVKENGTYREEYLNGYLTNDLGLIDPGSLRSTTFCIKLTTIGEVNVRLAIDSNGKVVEDLQKTINVKSEGVARSLTYPVLLELASHRQNVSHTADIVLPHTLTPHLVPNSFRVTADISGDVMGSAVENLGDLLKQPSGSGEQNMMAVASSIFLLEYLNQTGRAAKFLEKATAIMQTGYHQQLTFQRSDGSFSSFGAWDKYGSTWLSAFVLKVFSRLSFGVYPEPNLMRRLVGFLTSQQLPDGSFKEFGTLLHPSLHGSSGVNDMRLTAFVTIALLEAKQFLKDHDDTVALLRLTTALDKAVLYLGRRMAARLGDTDPYSSCILAYALSMAGPSNASATALNLMTAAATTVGTTIRYWAAADGGLAEEQVEMAGYGLLAYMQNKQPFDALKVFRWLNVQRGPYGGFGSTQATVIALQALSTMHSLALQSNFSDIHVNVSVGRTDLPEKSKSVSVDINRIDVVTPRSPNLNWLTEHTPRNIHVRASSDVPSGTKYFVMAQVTVHFTVKAVPASGALSANLSVDTSSAHSFRIQACTGRPPTADSDPMYVTEISKPTGYTVNIPGTRYGDVAHVSYAADKVIIYQLGSMMNTCHTLTMDMDRGRVAYVHPPTLHVYSLNNPKEEVAVGCSLTSHGICDIKPDQCS